MKPDKKITAPTPPANDDMDTILLNAAAAVNATRKRTADKKAAANKSIGKKLSDTADNIGVIADVVRGVKAGFGWINSTIVQPVLELPVVGKLLPLPFKLTYQGYYRFTHPYEGESFMDAVKKSATYPFRRAGEMITGLFRGKEVQHTDNLRTRGPLSRQRAGIAALATIWAMTGLFRVPVVGDAFNYAVAEPAVDVPRAAITMAFNGVSGNGFGLTHDTLYFGLPHKETGDDIYHVNASDHQNSDESNSQAFVVRDRALHEVWSWVHGRGPFRPDYVVAPIRPDVNKCEIISYGSRLRLARWASFKPDLLSVSCTSATAPASAPAPEGH